MIPLLINFNFQDLKEGTTTGISAADRALTIRQLANHGSLPEDFRRPGHVIPVKTAPGMSIDLKFKFKFGIELEILKKNHQFSLSEIIEFFFKSLEFSYNLLSFQLFLLVFSGGCVETPGHAESAVDLARLAGLPPVSASCAISNDDGTMAHLADVQRLGKDRGLKVVAIPDLIRYSVDLLMHP